MAVDLPVCRNVGGNALRGIGRVGVHHATLYKDIVADIKPSVAVHVARKTDRCRIDLDSVDGKRYDRARADKARSRHILAAVRNDG